MKLHLDHAHPTQIMMRVRTADGKVELIKPPSFTYLFDRGLVRNDDMVNEDDLCYRYCQWSDRGYEYLGLVKVDISEFGEKRKKSCRTCASGS